MIVKSAIFTIFNTQKFFDLRWYKSSLYSQFPRQGLERHPLPDIRERYSGKPGPYKIRGTSVLLGRRPIFLSQSGNIKTLNRYGESADL